MDQYKYIFILSTAIEVIDQKAQVSNMKISHMLLA